MSQAKPFASLSATLLARKGAARPAMRPQLAPLSSHELTPPTTPFETQDDLGWNDMGADHAAPAPAMAETPRAVEAPAAALPPAAPTPPPPPADVVPISAAVEETAAAAADEEPEVIKSLGRLARTIAAAPPAPRRPSRRSALSEGRRAAFTLRVDGERHLRLRLACTVQNRSAQALVTEALDRLLEDLPGLDELARRVTRR